MNGATPIYALVFLVLSGVAGCNKEKTDTKLVYFGFDDRSEAAEKTIELARTWGTNPPCGHWRATIQKENADYQVLFGNAETVTITDRRGELLYNGGVGVLYLPHGNPDGSGTNICRLTGEAAKVPASVRQ
jgi:hypothetical protein